jgi:hypothetical protein
MADSKGAAPTRRSRPAPRVVSPRNKVNIALPLSMIRVGEPRTMKPGDWISLAGVAVTAIGFSVAIRELNRIAHALEAEQASQRARQTGTSPPQPV